MVTKAVNVNTQTGMFRDNTVTDTQNENGFILPLDGKGNRKSLMELASFHLLNLHHQEQSTFKPKAVIDWSDSWYATLMLGDRRINSEDDEGGDNYVFPVDIEMQKVKHSRFNIKRMINTSIHGTMVLNKTYDGEPEHIKAMRIDLERIWKRYFQNFRFDSVLRYDSCSTECFFELSKDLSDTFIHWISNTLDLDVDYVRSRLGFVSTHFNGVLDLRKINGDMVHSGDPENLFTEVINLTNIALNMDSFRHELAEIITNYLIRHYDCSVDFRTSYFGLRKLVGDRLISPTSCINSLTKGDLEYNLNREAKNYREVPEITKVLDLYMDRLRLQTVDWVRDMLNDEFVNALYTMKTNRLQDAPDQLKGHIMLFAPCNREAFNFIELGVEVATYRLENTYDQPTPHSVLNTAGSEVKAITTEHESYKLLSTALIQLRSINSLSIGSGRLNSKRNLLARQIQQLFDTSYIYTPRIFEVMGITHARLPYKYFVECPFIDFYYLANITGHLQPKRKKKTTGMMELSDPEQHSKLDVKGLEERLNAIEDQVFGKDENITATPHPQNAGTMQM